jgi:magnesium transporter
MAASTTSVSSKAGLPPGTLVHVGEQLATETRISVIDYTGDGSTEHTVTTVEEIAGFRGPDSITWVNVEGLVNVAIIEAIGREFDIHPLVLEDILHTGQRPKFEEHDDYLFMVFKVMYPALDGEAVNYEQVSILILNDFVFTFKEKCDAIFDSIKARLGKPNAHFRKLGSDYLAYTLLDAVVDQYLSLQDYMDEALESIEDALLEDPDTGTLMTIQRVRHELIFMRRSVAPLRELVGAILRSDSDLISEATLIYYRDVYDHVLRVTDAFDTYRDMVSSLLEIYNTTISNRMNEIMKVLTAFATIFIPLTFLTGIYGMNFEYMPELKWKWSYPLLWVCFLVIPVALMIYFRKKKWL